MIEGIYNWDEQIYLNCKTSIKPQSEKNTYDCVMLGIG